MTAEFFTDRFHVRAIRQSDIHNIYRGLSDPNVVDYYGVSYRTLEETQTQMDWYAQIEREGTGQWFAITSPDGSIFYGAAGFSSLIREHQKAEIGIWILPEYWKRGIMREVFPPLCKYGFNELDLFRIEATVESENKNCIRAIEKVHFKREGTQRYAEQKNGRYIHLHLYARIVMDDVPSKP